tara:strand:- start:205 stop:540 length:336 start_codon:yes stop_codon:yes gene_type:complete
MSITFIWEINKNYCERDTSDGFFRKVTYRVKGLYDNEEKFRYTGSITLNKPETLPSDFINFDIEAGTPNQETMINWVKDNLGSSTVQLIESNMEKEINLLNNPIQSTGVAW